MENRQRTELIEELVNYAYTGAAFCMGAAFGIIIGIVLTAILF